jgi:Asp-tRNA(Asn)/Glu-tRNA(Gln) amidotransferase A subunit family amidase
VGFKPTYRRISLTGVIPLAPSADHVGYFCRDLGGAALVASILCHEWRDTEEEVQPALGIPEGPYLRRASEEGLAHFRETIDRLSDAGFEIRSVSVMSDFDEIAMRHHHLVAAEAAEVHREWFARFPDLYHPKTVDLIERGRGIAPDVLQLCRDSRHRLRESLQEIMVRQELSAWVAPSAVGPAPRGLDSTGDPVMNLPWTHAGLPVVNLPAGFSSNGLPLGLQVIGAWMRDEELMQLARDLSLECHPLQAVKECFIFWG